MEQQKISLIGRIRVLFELNYYFSVFIHIILFIRMIYSKIQSLARKIKIYLVFIVIPELQVAELHRLNNGSPLFFALTLYHIKLFEIII